MAPDLEKLRAELPERSNRANSEQLCDAGGNYLLSILGWGAAIGGLLGYIVQVGGECGLRPDQRVGGSYLSRPF